MIEFEPLPERISMGDKYDPAMMIETQEDANAYFEVLVSHCLHLAEVDGMPVTRAEACEIERSNLGYWAAYGDHATRERVERLFSCAHPVLGAIAVTGPLTPEQVFQIGYEWGERVKAEAEARVKAEVEAEPLNGMRNYILDADGNPVPEPDLMAWCRWFDTADVVRQVADTPLPGDIRVSTVFLAKDHQMGTGKPILYETMVFGGNRDGYQSRYHTRDEALYGHGAVVLLAKAGAPRQE